MKRGPKSKSKSGSSAKRPEARWSKFQAFAETDWSLADLPIHRDALARNGADVIEAMNRVRDYRAFLRQARAAKAAGRGTDIDREVLARARVFQSDAAAGTAAAARMLRALHVGGAFNRVTTAMNKSLKAAGAMKVKELWDHIRTTEAYQPTINRKGISAMLQDAEGVLARTDLTVRADGAGIRLEGSVDGNDVRARMTALSPAVGLPRRPLDLLYSGRFVALCDVVERGEPAYLLGTGHLREIPSLEDYLMTDLLGAQRQVVRHVRKLEDAGLSTYSGGGPLAIAAGIFAALLLIGIIWVSTDCEKPEGGLGSNDSTSCKIGRLVMMLGLMGLLLTGVFSLPDKDPFNTTGGQNISGPLPQLQS